MLPMLPGNVLQKGEKLIFSPSWPRRALVTADSPTERDLRAFAHVVTDESELTGLPFDGTLWGTIRWRNTTCHIFYWSAFR